MTIGCGGSNSGIAPGMVNGEIVGFLDFLLLGNIVLSTPKGHIISSSINRKKVDNFTYLAPPPYKQARCNRIFASFSIFCTSASVSALSSALA